MADLDEDEYDALLGAVQERQQSEAWGNLHEAVAAAVEALWMILARLDAGIPTVQIEKSGKPAEMGAFPRPSWVEDRAPAEPLELVVTSPAEAFRVLKGGKS